MSTMRFSSRALKNLFSRPATLMYPVKKRVFYARTRGHIDISIGDCIFCGICQRKCPTGAIVVTKADKTWQIDRLKCIQCNACGENCPKKCLSMGNAYTDPPLTRSKEAFNDA